MYSHLRYTSLENAGNNALGGKFRAGLLLLECVLQE